MIYVPEHADIFHTVINILGVGHTRACCLMVLTVCNIAFRQGHIPMKDWVWNTGVVIVTAEDSNTRRKAVLTDPKHLRSKQASRGTAGCVVE